MTPLSHRHQLSIGLTLILLMVLTRGQHLSLVGYVPDASWAVFFLAGIYLRPVWALPAYMIVALVLDIAAVTWGGVSGFCISPAYFMLVPAHAFLWGAGRWCRRAHRNVFSTLLNLSVAVLLSSALAELFSSGGFYLFSGRFADLSLAEMSSRFLTYYPFSLEALTLYVGMAVMVHAVVMFAAGKHLGRVTGG